MPSRIVMSVASATRLFAAGTTADDTLCRCVTGKDSSEAFIDSSANHGTVSPASCGAPACYGGLFTSYSNCTNGSQSYVNRSSADPLRRPFGQRWNRRSWHLSRVVKPGGCPDV